MFSESEKCASVYTGRPMGPRRRNGQPDYKAVPLPIWQELLVGVEMVLYPQNLEFAGEVLERAFDLQVSVRFDPYVPASNDPAARVRR